MARLWGVLRERDRWLLIFDNAEDPAVLAEYLPGGGGHVVITSRNPDWQELATPVGVDVFDRGESITLLRRRAPRLISQGSLRIDMSSREVTVGGRPVDMTRKEFDLLRYLVEHQGEVITRDRLLDEVWGYDRFPTTRTVDTHILRLRQKFERDPERPEHILTAHGQGYRFAGHVAEEPRP